MERVKAAVRTSCRLKFACALGALVVGGTGWANATPMTFEGRSVLVQEFIEEPPFILTELPVTVGPGVELEGFGNSAGGIFFFNIDLAATSITLTTIDGFDNDAGIFGFRFSDAENMIDPFRSATIAASSLFTGLSDSSVRIVDNELIVVDFENVGAEAGATMRIEVEFIDTETPVIPLPATLPLALGGIAALGLAGRLRRRA